MKEYYVLSIEQQAQDTEDKINRFAKKGWKLVCSYAYGNRWLIMEREYKAPKKCKSCGRTHEN